MSEVLAYAAAFLEECLDRSSDLRGFGIEAKILVDSSREIANRLEQRTSWKKRISRVSCQIRICADTFGIENELVGVENFHATVAIERPRHGLPARRS